MLMLAIRKAHLTQTFALQVAKWAEEVVDSPQWANLVKNGSTTRMWTYINEEVRKIALSLYSQGKTKSNTYCLLREENKDRLRIRREKTAAIVNLQSTKGVALCFEMWRLQIQIDVTTKKLRIILKMEKNQTNKERSDELFLAWQKHDHAHVWKLAKLLGNRDSMGNSNRCQLTTSQWREGLCREGSSGGYNAEGIEDWDTWAQTKEQEYWLDRWKNIFVPMEECENDELPTMQLGLPVVTTTFVSGGLISGTMQKNRNTPSSNPEPCCQGCHLLISDCECDKQNLMDAVDHNGEQTKHNQDMEATPSCHVWNIRAPIFVPQNRSSLDDPEMQIMPCEDDEDLWTCPPDPGPSPHAFEQESYSQAEDDQAFCLPCDMFGNELSTCPHLATWNECKFCWCVEHNKLKNICNKCKQIVDDCNVLEAVFDKEIEAHRLESNNGVCRLMDKCPIEVTPVIRKLVLQDLRAIKTSIKHAKCRRTVPSNALPNEVWRLLLCELLPCNQQTSGIGYDTSIVTLRPFHEIFCHVLVLARVTGCPPVQWHCSQAFSLYKKDPNDVEVLFDAQRTIHSLDPIGKAYFRNIYNKSNIPVVQPFEYAYVPGRRRETAIKQQLILQHRLSAQGLSSEGVSYDMKNAFASIKFEAIDNTFMGRVCPEDEHIFQQRYKCTSMKTKSGNTSAHFAIGSGSMPGDKIAADIFRNVFQEPMIKWTQACKQEQTIIDCPVLHRKIDVSKSVYADDIFSRRVIPPGRATVTCVLEDQHNIDVALDECIGPTGLSQNKSKQEIIFSLHGKGAHEHERDLKKHVNKRVVDALLYLGAWLCANGKNTKEIATRLCCAWSKWNAFKGLFCCSHIPLRIRRLCFVSLVYNSLISALEAFVLTDKEYDKLTMFICQRSRGLLLGKAHTKHDGKHSQLSNVQVLRKVRLLPVHLELMVRRVKWLIAIVAKPGNAGAMIAAWLGELPNESANYVNPWKQQLQRDLEYCAIVPYWEDFFTQAMGNPICLFNDYDMRSTFLKLDARELRAVLLDSLTHAFVDKNNTIDKPCGVFTCDIVMPDGSVCGHQSNTKAGIWHHQVLAKSPNHGLRSAINLVVVTNQCCMCRSVFADKITTQHHVKNSLSKGRCCADRGYKCSKPVEPDSLKCPFSQIGTVNNIPMCQFEAKHLSQLQDHIMEHLQQDNKEHVLSLDVPDTCKSLVTRLAARLHTHVTIPLAHGPASAAAQVPSFASTPSQANFALASQASTNNGQGRLRCCSREQHQARRRHGVDEHGRRGHSSTNRLCLQSTPSGHIQQGRETREAAPHEMHTPPAAEYEAGLEHSVVVRALRHGAGNRSHCDWQEVCGRYQGQAGPRVWPATPPDLEEVPGGSIASHQSDEGGRDAEYKECHRHSPEVFRRVQPDPVQTSQVHQTSENSRGQEWRANQLGYQSVVSSSQRGRSSTDRHIGGAQSRQQYVQAGLIRPPLLPAQRSSPPLRPPPATTLLTAAEMCQTFAKETAEERAMKDALSR